MKLKRSAKIYTVQVTGLMAVYCVLLLLSVWLLGKFSDTPWRIPLAILPAIPLLFVVWAVIRFVRTVDEFQKSIHLEAMAFSFLSTVVITLTYGFLENAGLPHFPLVGVPVLMCCLWGVGAALSTVKYR